MEYNSGGLLLFVHASFFLSFCSHIFLSVVLFTHLSLCRSVHLTFNLDIGTCSLLTWFYVFVFFFFYIHFLSTVIVFLSCVNTGFFTFQVAEVEEEMRQMLTENQGSKKAMEDKMKRLTQAMTDLQTDLYQ